MNQCWLLTGPVRRSCSKIWIKQEDVHLRTCIWKYRLQNGSQHAWYKCVNGVHILHLFLVCANVSYVKDAALQQQPVRSDLFVGNCPCGIMLYNTTSVLYRPLRAAAKMARRGVLGKSWIYIHCNMGIKWTPLVKPIKQYLIGAWHLYPLKVVKLFSVYEVLLRRHS